MSPSPRGAVRSVCAIPLTAPPHATRAALVGLLSVLVGCAGDHTIAGPNGVAREGMIVSHPVPPPALSPRGGRAAAAAASASGDSVVYASLLPKTVPTGVTATVRALTSGATVTTAIQDGGFDPVALTAKVGDSVTTVVVDGTDSVLFRAAAAVTPIRRISVIRTDPGSGKRDQPLNANIVIVFSGPVDVTTLTASVQLFNGTTSIPGTVSLLAGSPTTAVFSPSRPLDQNTDYRLVVTTGVEDITGGSLDADIAVTFTTGTTMVLPASTVTVSPDTSALAIAWQGQLTAVARDTIGTLIVGRPFNWTSDNPVVATVSAGGLVTALAGGVAHVQAEMDGPSALATIQVSVALAPVASVAVAPGSAKLVVGGFVEVSAEPRDAAGNLPVPSDHVAEQQSYSGHRECRDGEYGHRDRRSRRHRDHHCIDRRSPRNGHDHDGNRRALYASPGSGSHVRPGGRRLRVVLGKRGPRQWDGTYRTRAGGCRRQPALFAGGVNLRAEVRWARVLLGRQLPGPAR